MSNLYMENWEEYAKKIYSEHYDSHYNLKFEAYLILDNPNFFIADWRDKNGSGSFATRFILDKKSGNLVITGDSGYCVASWHSANTPHDIASYLNDPCYFIEKMKCSTNMYRYEWDDVKDDINQFRKEVLEIVTDPDDELEDSEGNIITEERCNKDFDEMLSLLYESWSLVNGCICTEKFEDIMIKYDPEWWEHAAYGQRIDEGVYLWMYGFRECVKRLCNSDSERKPKGEK